VTTAVPAGRPTRSASFAEAARQDAGVHLHLRGTLDEDAVTALREQLAACLGAGIRHITVHVERQSDLELPILQVLSGAARYLTSRGGSLVLAGAQPAVLRRLAINEMTDLLGSQEGARKTAAAASRARRS
jgi:anti-anti-sigma factor